MKYALTRALLDLLSNVAHLSALRMPSGRRFQHERNTTTVTKLIDSNKLPHLLFYGPPGTGKTSTILACARKLYGDEFKMMVLEVSTGVTGVLDYSPRRTTKTLTCCPVEQQILVRRMWCTVVVVHRLSLCQPPGNSRALVGVGECNFRQ